MNIPTWLFWSLDIGLFISGAGNVILALALRSARKQAEVDAICNL